MSNSEAKWTATTLNEEQLAELDFIKAYHGLQSTSDALRFLIRKEARSIASDAPLFAAPVRDRVEAS